MTRTYNVVDADGHILEPLDLWDKYIDPAFRERRPRFVESSIAVLANYIGPHKIMWATDYPHQDGFFPGAPQMLRERLGPMSPEAKHQVLAGGALGFYGLS